MIQCDNHNIYVKNREKERLSEIWKSERERKKGSENYLNCLSSVFVNPLLKENGNIYFTDKLWKRDRLYSPYLVQHLATSGLYGVSFVQQVAVCNE